MAVDENAVMTSKFRQLRTSGNVEIIDGMRGGSGSNPLTSADRRPLLYTAFGVKEGAIG